MRGPAISPAFGIAFLALVWAPLDARAQQGACCANLVGCYQSAQLDCVLLGGTCSLFPCLGEYCMTGGSCARSYRRLVSGTRYHLRAELVSASRGVRFRRW